MGDRIPKAVAACRVQASSIFLVYVISCGIGIVMAHQGNQFALSQRDKIVGAAYATESAAQEHSAGKHVEAALHDFLGNVFLAAIPQAVIGLGVVPPYFTVACQGWVGGIVSVDGEHRSRFTSFHATAYYFLVLLLQTAAFSLAIGAGVRCGLDTYRHNAETGWQIWRFRIPRESLINAGAVILVSLPIFLAGSLFEFLSSWNG